MDLSAKNLKLISRAVKYLLADLRIQQMSSMKANALTDAPIDTESAADLVRDIADYTQLHQELEICQRYKEYPLSD